MLWFLFVSLREHHCHTIIVGVLTSSLVSYGAQTLQHVYMCTLCIQLSTQSSCSPSLLLGLPPAAPNPAGGVQHHPQQYHHHHHLDSGAQKLVKPLRNLDPHCSLDPAYAFAACHFPLNRPSRRRKPARYGHRVGLAASFPAVLAGSLARLPLPVSVVHMWITSSTKECARMREMNNRQLCARSGPSRSHAR